MPHPIVHAEIRSADPDATRAFFGDLLSVPGVSFALIADPQGHIVGLAQQG